MTASTPEELHVYWVNGINAGDLEGVTELYEQEAAFIVRPGQVVVGRTAIRDATAALIALTPRATLEVLQSIVTGDLALLISRWQLTGTDADGNPVDVIGQTSDVARRQADGTWRFVIDNPWGDAAGSVSP